MVACKKKVDQNVYFFGINIVFLTSCGWTYPQRKQVSIKTIFIYENIFHLVKNPFTRISFFCVLSLLRKYLLIFLFFLVCLFLFLLSNKLFVVESFINITFGSDNTFEDDKKINERKYFWYKRNLGQLLKVYFCCW